METKLGLISQRAAKEPDMKFESLMHHINEGSLKANFYELGRNRAAGVDGVSWQEYEKGLESNVEDLLGRMKRMGYKPQAARRVYIPKDRHMRRPLGLPTIEDKIVQKTMARIMEAIYEQDFHECSYGFRAGKNCHQALKRVNDLINFKSINHVIEADIKGFFDNVSHEKLMELIKIRIKDEKFLRYLVRFLKAGYMEAGKLEKTEQGTPQGGNLSPMLANIFLHYVLDEWFEKEVKPSLKGQCYVVRYCDDFVILAQYKEEAKSIMKQVQERFMGYELELHPEKTSVKSFGRYERENSRNQRRKANTFEFLGFTHYCAISRKGKFKVGRRTSAKKLRKSCMAMNQWLKEIRNAVKLKEWWTILKTKINGHYRYYGVSENMRSVHVFYKRTLELVLKWLNRRSHRKSFSWAQFESYLKRYPLPKPHIVHSFYTVSHAE
ncbi:MAG: group II intron reverse transcriptase/maturase [Candidatus Ancaeobacter aquaticus]|nr:group II intron reverse transcriptase/maturase [Candidatus Ancaeobacter aquaticus]